MPGYVFMFESGAISWCSKKQPILTLSTTEIKFTATTVCATQAIQLKNIPVELFLVLQKPTLIYCDNGSAIKLSNNSIFQGRSKHIDVKLNFLRDLTKDKIIEVVYCKSEHQATDTNQVSQLCNSCKAEKANASLYFEGVCHW